MLYKLERRATGLAMSSALMNFLMHNKIPYKYDFAGGGIEITEEDAENIRINFNSDSIPEYVPEVKPKTKTSKRRSLF